LLNQVLTCSYQDKQEVMATNKKQPGESVSGAAATTLSKLEPRYICRVVGGLKIIHKE
jgi:hypothetical protein